MKSRRFYELFGTYSASQFKSSLQSKLVDLLLFLISLRNSDLEVPSEFENSSVTSNRRFYELFGTYSASQFKSSLQSKLVDLLQFLTSVAKLRLRTLFEN